jgi:hypothetical protein
MKFTYVLELEVTTTSPTASPPEDGDIEQLKAEIADDLDAAPLGPWTIKRRKYELVDWVVKAE